MRFFCRGELSIMPLPTFKLFLGFPVDDSLLGSLAQVDEAVKDFFIQQGDCYLQKVTNAKGMVYLGKFVGEKANLQELHAVEANIYSLLKRMTPDFPFEQTALRLFPAEEKKSV